MRNFENIAIDELLKSELGSKADFYKYTSDNRTPMTFVMDEIKRHIGDIFSVYWVEGGYPEVFCLDGFSKSIIVFNTRYLSLSVFIRQLFVSNLFENFLPEIAERNAFQLVAEIALRKGDPDLAVLAFVKSVTGKSISTQWGANEQVDVMALEYEAKNEAYMATWFYGLAHECGHLSSYQNEVFPVDHIFSDKTLLQAIDGVLDTFPYTDTIKKEAKRHAEDKTSRSILEVNQIRNEGFADMFASGIMLQTTYDIMKEVGGDEFNIMSFISETIIFHCIISFMDRCRRIALMASATNTDQVARMEFVLQPVAIAVRNLIQRQYLDHAVTKFIFGDTPTEQQYKTVTDAINEITISFKEVNDKIDKGLSLALEFLLFPERRKNDWVLLEEFRQDLLQSKGLRTIELQRFCDMADSLGKNSKLLNALKKILTDPSQLPIADPAGDFAFFVPWVEGPNGFNRPLGLDTKYGHLIFAFHNQGELYNNYFSASAEDLKKGYELKRAIVAVPHEKQLGRELATYMPQGLTFGIIVEGTDKFTHYMQELSDGSIWL